MLYELVKWGFKFFFLIQKLKALFPRKEITI